MERLADRLDAVADGVGRAVRWLALGMVLLQFAVVILRYVFGVSYVWLTEGVLYQHAALFMLGAAYALLVEGHVRVDIFYARLSPRRRAAVDVAGALLLLAPAMLLALWWTWPSVSRSVAILEGALSVGGIPASFLLKALIPTFCVLLLAQGLARLLRDLARLAAR